jgi:hypothetical protein
MRNFAKRLITYEAGEKRSPGTNTPAAFHACEKLRLHLATFMGNTGFHTLLARALALAGAEVPWLHQVHSKGNGPLEGWQEILPHLDPDEVSDGGVVLLAQLLGLLVAFIGENLTVRLVREVWPKVPLDHLELTNGGKK